MTRGPERERLAEAMAFFSQGDLKRFGDILLAYDVVWHWSGSSSVSGKYRGREAALGLLRGFHELTRNRLLVDRSTYWRARTI